MTYNTPIIPVGQNPRSGGSHGEIPPLVPSYRQRPPQRRLERLRRPVLGLGGRQRRNEDVATQRGTQGRSAVGDGGGTLDIVT